MKKVIVVVTLLILIGVLALEIVTLSNIIKTNQSIPTIENIQ